MKHNSKEAKKQIAQIQDATCHLETPAKKSLMVST